MLSALTSETQTKIDRVANTISMTRYFAAPRERIFEAWTQPEHLACWWDPTGARLAQCEIDLRPGGRFRFVNQGMHGAPAFEGVYLEIAPPERLAFEALGSVGTVALEQAEGGARMTVTIQCQSPERLEHFLQMGVADGTSRTLDNLVAYFARPRRP
jgi:uncharacterized protein YndB with AHSA1/START domain